MRYLLCVFILGCAAGSVDPLGCPRALTPRCEHSVTYSIAGDFPPEQRDAIRYAASMWANGSNDRLCVHEVADGTYHVYPTHRGMIGHAGGLTTFDPFGQNTIQIVVDRPQYVALIAAHEFGHALGAEHTSEGTRSIMHKKAGGLDEPLAVRAGAVWPEDVEEVCLRAGCGSCR